VLAVSGFYFGRIVRPETRVGHEREAAPKCAARAYKGIPFYMYVVPLVVPGHLLIAGVALIKFRVGVPLG
jgi:hypothetical protein